MKRALFSLLPLLPLTLLGAETFQPSKPPFSSPTSFSYDDSGEEIIVFDTPEDEGGRAAGNELPAAESLVPELEGVQLKLYSYVSLGIEVRAVTDEEFAEIKKTLAPVPKSGSYTIRSGEPAFMRSQGGLIVTRVIPGSPAEKEGVREGDFLLNTGGIDPWKSPDELYVVLRNCTPGFISHLHFIRDGRWWNIRPRAAALPEPELLGTLMTDELSAEDREELQLHRRKLMRLLAEEPVNVKEVGDAMESICRAIYKKGYTPGCLCLPLRSGACSITATRYGWNIDIRMVEDGKETSVVLKHFEEGANIIPEPIRSKLMEVKAPLAPPIDKPAYM